MFVTDAVTLEGFLNGFGADPVGEWLTDYP